MTPLVKISGSLTSRDLGMVKRPNFRCELIPVDPVSICIRNDTAASHIVCNSECDLKCFGNESMPEPFSCEAPVYRKPREQNEWQVVWGKSTNVILREALAGHTCRCESEVSDNCARRTFVDRDISHSNKAFLLIRPRVPP